MPRAPSVRSLFLARVFFSVAFSTVFQSFLTRFLIDSGYKKPIQNKDELYESGIKLFYPPVYKFVFENGDETEISRLQRNRANCPSPSVCINWVKYHKNVSILFPDFKFELYCTLGYVLGENSEPLMCRLEDGVVYYDGIRLIMFHGDPLIKRVSEIIDRVVEAGLYSYWISQVIDRRILFSRTKAIDDPLDGYYSFNLYHMQPAFCFLLIGLCLSALCFIVEVLYNRVLSKRKWIQ
jgi:hypothetical protein